MNPIELKRDTEAQNRFRELMTENITFVKDWTAKEVTPQHMRLYHRRLSAQDALDKYIEDTKKTLEENNISYRISSAIDMKKASDSLSSFRKSNDKTMEKLLDRTVRETRRVLFFPGATFEATVNTDHFSQSQLMIMLDVPSQAHIDQGSPVSMMAAPPGLARTTGLFDITNPPRRTDLEAKGWKHVTVQMAETRPVVKNHIVATRRQYTVKHLAASTVSDFASRAYCDFCAREAETVSTTLGFAFTSLTGEQGHGVHALGALCDRGESCHTDFCVLVSCTRVNAA